MVTNCSQSKTDLVVPDHKQIIMNTISGATLVPKDGYGNRLIFLVFSFFLNMQVKPSTELSKKAQGNQTFKFKVMCKQEP